MPTTSAKVIADSVSPLGVRVTSLELCFPRIVLPQFLNHRAFSRSAESMRARPVLSKVAEVNADPFVPKFADNKKGMQPGEKLAGDRLALAELLWLNVARDCALAARKLAELGVAKQHVNRLIETFSYVKVLVTATDFANYFRLRCADDAQEEITELANAMRAAIEQSVPKRVEHGEWHLPYIRKEDGFGWKDTELLGSTARCARVSYTKHDGTTSPEDDCRLAGDLMDAGHSNPFEHQVTPAYDRRRYANFRGWVSQRYLMEQDGRLPNPEG